MKVVVNRCFGGFGISRKAAEFMAERGNQEAKEKIESTCSYWYGSLYDTARNDPVLVAAVEALGKEANGPYAELEVVEIPDGIEWEIDEYDGNERVEEVHRS